MRARLALMISGIKVELREVVLRDKPAAFLAASDSGTVPCMVTKTKAIDESLDIMTWALSENDPEGWLDMPEDGWGWITRSDGPFKAALDRTKYGTRYPDANRAEELRIASDFLSDLNEQLGPWIFNHATIADYAILPFVRQFAFIDKAWFDAQPWPRLHEWLETFLRSERFDMVMQKYPQWSEGDQPITFP